MVRNRKPTKRTRPDDSTIAEAVECVMNNTMSIRKVSAMIGMHRATLHRAIAKRRNAPNGNIIIIIFSTSTSPKSVY
ncbi:hypothetical protein EB796_005440 [Bugula neritina]|uniref:HTH psq-type domain-containing protein n=1 Tax=Bugula neritina TaxID=10212 RepID=A0A7J7KFN0_BUGNE|nr:hypothetical protein EB796_005440 [Bugula neritina]